MRRIAFKIACLILLYFTTGASVFCQVEIKDKIILTSPNPNERQVKGLAYPDSPSSAVNASAVQSGQLVYSAATGNDTLLLTLHPAPLNYVKGMVVYFKAPSTNTSSVKINVNGLGIVPLFKEVNQNIDSAEILAGRVISAIFDGNAFQVTCRLNQPCPSGFVDVNAKYCIEINERDSLNFYDAMKTCGDLNGKICSWSEWYYACQKTALGLNDMTNNFEWIDDGANYTSSAINARVAGSPDCVTPSSIPVNNTNLNKFRCCYYRK
ncbi:MAG TPA: hypothetical protein VK177_02715 [Flavobacteriales bacterium]|nr:hypothetical protein [Flavobacteriales bacterium]